MRPRAAWRPGQLRHQDGAAYPGPASARSSTPSAKNWTSFLAAFLHRHRWPPGTTPAGCVPKPPGPTCAGLAPIPAGSGKTVRHRLNPGGNRQANAALHHIVVTRMSPDARTLITSTGAATTARNTLEIIRTLNATSPARPTSITRPSEGRSGAGLTRHRLTAPPGCP